MSTQAVTQAPVRTRSARTVFSWLSWAFVAGLAVYFFVTTVPNYFHFDADHYAYYWPKKWWLIAHISGGSVALTMGMFQFSTTLRKKYVKVHRWMGRLYLMGVLVGSIGAAYMGIFVSPLRAFGISLEFLALAWVVTSGMAYVAVMRRQFAAHREWMIRSYVVTFGFVLFRLGSRNHVFGSLGPEMAPVMLSWTCWAVPLLVTDVVMRWRQTMGTKVRA
jgi:hypothetical protein